MAESTISQPGSNRRVKRAARACNHCRWKRLKCSDQSQNESCMNCIIYGTKCEYTAAWPQQPGKRKERADGGSSSTGRARKKIKRRDTGSALTPGESISGDNSSISSKSLNEEEHEKLEAECSGKNAADVTDVTTIVANDALTETDSSMLGIIIASQNQDANEGVVLTERDPNTVLVHDQLGKKLVHYLTPMMTGVDNDEDIALSAEDAGLPPQPVAEALVTAFFDNVAPLYPVLDEQIFRVQLQQYYQSLQHVDRLWLLLVKLVMCVGAASGHDSANLGHDIKRLRETLFSQVLSSAYLMYCQAKLRNAQILLLVALYCVQMKKPNSAWLWCRWGIRLQRHWVLRKERPILINETADATAYKDIVTWSLFILESHLSLMQFRDDPRMADSMVNQPNEEVKKRFPVFCHRLALARIINRFCRIGLDTSPNATDFADKIEEIHSNIAAWREAIPIGYQPESDIFVEKEEYQSVLLMHLEYHTLLLSMFTALGAASRLMPKDKPYKAHPSVRVRNQIAVRISNARRLLHTINTIADSAHLKPCVSSWLSSVQILSPFSFIYSHVMRRPSLISARSDLELLFNATQHFRRYMLDSPRNKNIAALITAMYNAALNFTAQARLPSSAPGPESATAEALQRDFSDLPTGPGPSVTPTTNVDEEFDYSPTITPAFNHSDMMNQHSFIQPASNFHFDFQSNFPAHEGGGPPGQPPTLTDAEATAWLAAQQNGSVPGIPPIPNVVGIAIMGNGWDEWTWQNDFQPPI